MITLKFPMKAISKDNEKVRNKYGYVYLSSKFKGFESDIGTLARMQYHDEPIEDDIIIILKFYFKNRRHTDLLNLPKSVADALTGVCYKDDRQIKYAVIECVEDSQEEYFTVFIDRRYK